MSLVTELRDGVTAALQRVRRVRRDAVVLRCLAWLLGALALALVVPTSWWAGRHLAIVVVVAGVALLPAAGAGSWLVLAVELLVCAGWLLRTTAFGDPVALLPLLALAVLLYLHHGVCALAAVLPPDARILRGTAVRWAARTGLVAAATALVGVVATVADAWSGSVSTVAVPVLGVLAAVGLVAVIARTARGRRLR